MSEVRGYTLRYFSVIALSSINNSQCMRIITLKKSYSVFSYLFKEYCTCKIGQSSKDRTEGGKYLHVQLKRTSAEALLQSVIINGRILFWISCIYFFSPNVFVKYSAIFVAVSYAWDNKVVQFLCMYVCIIYLFIYSFIV